MARKRKYPKQPGIMVPAEIQNETSLCIQCGEQAEYVRFADGRQVGQCHDHYYNHPYGEAVAAAKKKREGLNANPQESAA
jgi:hypothetical protein